MQKRIFILKNSSWNNTFIAEAMDFPAVDHDDQIDALSLIGRQFTSIPRPTIKNDVTKEINFFLQKKDGQLMTTVPLDELYDENQRGGILSISRRRI